MTADTAPCLAPDDALEPAVAAILARTLAKRARGPYAARTVAEVRAALQRLCEANGCREVQVSEVQRLAGGASKEMFAFTLTHAALAAPERLVLRMDPLESIIETSRQREAQAIAALGGVVPAPTVRFVDHAGEHLGQSGVVTTFVAGVTRPATAAGGVTGLGTDYGAAAARIAPQFLDNLVAIHAFDWRHAALADFAVPASGTTQAALWQANWYERIWLQDALEAIPLVSLLRHWLREHAPVCHAPCFVHGDYRMGNFLFDEASGAMTAVLDWELAHIGDFHEDVGYVTQKLFGRVDEAGRFLCCGLFDRETFLREYETRSGRRIDRATLHYYEILNAWKSVVHTFATCLRVAAAGNNHQDVLLSWLAPVGHLLLADIAHRLKAGPTP